MSVLKRSPIGERVLRVEDQPLLAGKGRFAADWWFADTLHMRVVRSNVAHGDILSVDVKGAKAIDGVVSVLTYEDIAGLPPIDFRATTFVGLEPFRQPILAQGRVRYVGEPIAAVLAKDPYIAEDAAQLVLVDIEEKPAVIDAAADPSEFLTGENTEVTVIRKSYGDVEGAFSAPNEVIELDLRIAVSYTHLTLPTSDLV